MATPRRIPDDLWEEIEKLLPAPPSRARGGRTRADDRKLLDGMLYVLWTGCPWRALPRQEFGAWQTVYDRFAEWKCAGVFEQIWARCLHLYDNQHGIDWQWQAADGTYVRAPLGGKSRRAQSHRPRQARLQRPSLGGWARGAAPYGRDAGECERWSDPARGGQQHSYRTALADVGAAPTLVSGRRL